MESIVSLKVDEERPLLTIYFKNGIYLYIRYNDFGEYSYQIMVSQDKYDRICYDNYDDH